MAHSYDVIIVGGGPAGSAAALQLARREPARASRTLLLEAAVSPREKLCGGGVIRQSDRLLAHLGVVADVPSVAIDAIRFTWAGGETTLRAPAAFRVVHRLEFDRLLLDAARAAGVVVHEGEAVLRLERERDALLVTTTRGAHRGAIVIGADGAKSRVRRMLVGPSCGAQFVALEVLTPGHDEPDTAVFDFRPALRGVRGYAWHFPSLRAGQPCVNRGLGGTCWPPDTSLRALFAATLHECGVALGSLPLAGWSAPLYDPASPQSCERVLLAGDALGVDPWLGEGISVAIGSGLLAAHAALDALASGRFAFDDYGARVRESAVGWQLGRNLAIADPFYEAAAKPQGLDAWLATRAAP